MRRLAIAQHVGNHPTNEGGPLEHVATSATNDDALVRIIKPVDDELIAGPTAVEATLGLDEFGVAYA